MEELQRVYRQALPARIAELENARSAEGEPARAAIRRIAHALRGSGGTYGFPQISKAAHAVEDADDAALRATVDELIAVLRVTAEYAHPDDGNAGPA